MIDKPSNCYFQSGVIPYRVNSGEVEVLLIKSKRGKWIFPKGIIEAGFSAVESAAKEAFEEAGIKGTIQNDICGEYNYKKWGGVCNVKIFPMTVEEVFDKWTEDDFRVRKWFPINKAAKKVKRTKLSSLLSLVPGTVNEKIKITEE